MCTAPSFRNLFSLILIFELPTIESLQHFFYWPANGKQFIESSTRAKILYF